MTKYYIKAKNTKTNKAMIMTTPVFTNKTEAQEFVNSMTELLTPVAELVVIKENER